VQLHVVGELQPVRNIGNYLLYSEGPCVLGCEFSYLGTTWEGKVGRGQVDLIARLENKGTAAGIGVLFLPILGDCEQGLAS
jgi:hypothetical protein